MESLEYHYFWNRTQKVLAIFKLIVGYQELETQMQITTWAIASLLQSIGFHLPLED